MATANTELFSGLPLVFEKSSASNPAENPFRDWELENVIALALLMVSRVDRLRDSWFPATMKTLPISTGTERSKSLSFTSNG